MVVYVGPSGFVASCMDHAKQTPSAKQEQGVTIPPEALRGVEIEAWNTVGPNPTKKLQNLSFESQKYRQVRNVVEESEYSLIGSPDHAL